MNCEGRRRQGIETTACQYRWKMTVESCLITSTAPCWIIPQSQEACCGSSLHGVWTLTDKYCVTWLAQMTREQLALHFPAPTRNNPNALKFCRIFQPCLCLLRQALWSFILSQFTCAFFFLYSVKCPFSLA